MRNVKTWFVFLFLVSLHQIGLSLPQHFIYLQQIDPSIQQELRYASNHNFIGRPIEGYKANRCILTKAAALALKQIQNKLKPYGLSLKVYDCYRPMRATRDFYTWSLDPKQTKMKGEFYPYIRKSRLFEEGYIAQRSGHTRGSTVDITLADYPAGTSPKYTPERTLRACMLPQEQRFKDNSIDMGTSYDCMDRSATFGYTGIRLKAMQNRWMLRYLMVKYGFEPYDQEWWHFTLKDEPYPDTYFDFPIT